MRYHYIATGMAEIKYLSVPSTYKDKEQVEFLCIASRNEKGCSHAGKYFGGFF